MPERRRFRTSWRPSTMMMIAVGDVRPRREALRTEGHDLGHLDALTHFVEQVRTGGLRLLDHRGEQRPGALDDLVALRHADVLDFLHLDRRLAGADAVDRLECRGQDRRLDLVQRGRDVDESLGPSLLALHVDFDASDAAAFLQVA